MLSPSSYLIQNTSFKSSPSNYLTQLALFKQSLKALLFSYLHSTSSLQNKSRHLTQLVPFKSRHLIHLVPFKSRHLIHLVPFKPSHSLSPIQTISFKLPPSKQDISLNQQTTSFKQNNHLEPFPSTSFLKSILSIIITFTYYYSLTTIPLLLFPYYYFLFS